MEKEQNTGNQPADGSQGKKKKTVSWWLKLLTGIADIVVTVFGKKKD